MKLKNIPDHINLLYVEDDPTIVQLVSEQLNSSKHTHFNITVKSTLKDALDFLCNECVLEEYKVDVVLLDLVLPNSHGVDTFLRVKEHCVDIPVVIISAHEDIACKCVALGAQDYLVKPDIPPSLLIRSIKYSIQRHSIENKMKNVIMTSSLGYHMYELKDDKLIFVGFNPASNKILEVDNREFIGKEMNEAFPGLPDYIEHHYRLALQGTPWVNERVVYGNDKIKNAVFRVNAYKTAENFLTVTFEDITEKIRIEEALQKTLDKYKKLVEVTGAGIYGIDFINNKFTYVNDVMCRQLGYTREELLSMGPSDILTQESINTWAQRFAALDRGEYIEDTVEYEAIKKDGSTMWVLVTAQYIEDDNGNVIGANVVAIDITDKKRAQETIEKKEMEVYSQLERKIQDWKEELQIRTAEKETRLKLIDAEILALSPNNKVEVL